MPHKELTADRLRSLLNYDPDSGAFSYRVCCGPKSAGSTAGCLSNRRYWVITINRVHYQAHRLAWLYVHGCWPVDEIDHCDGERTNNRITNLRDVARLANNQNQRAPRSDNSTGFLGVTRDRRSLAKPFKAQIMVLGKTRMLGYFVTGQDAYDAYLTAKRELHQGCTL